LNPWHLFPLLLFLLVRASFRRYGPSPDALRCTLSLCQCCGATLCCQDGSIPWHRKIWCSSLHSKLKRVKEAVVHRPLGAVLPAENRSMRKWGSRGSGTFFLYPRQSPFLLVRKGGKDGGGRRGGGGQKVRTLPRLCGLFLVFQRRRRMVVGQQCRHTAHTKEGNHTRTTIHPWYTGNKSYTDRRKVKPIQKRTLSKRTEKGRRRGGRGRVGRVPYTTPIQVPLQLVLEILSWRRLYQQRSGSRRRCCCCRRRPARSTAWKILGIYSLRLGVPIGKQKICRENSDTQSTSVHQ